MREPGLPGICVSVSWLPPGLNAMTYQPRSDAFGVHHYFAWMDNLGNDTPGGGKCASRKETLIKIEISRPRLGDGDAPPRLRGKTLIKAEISGPNWAAGRVPSGCALKH